MTTEKLKKGDCKKIVKYNDEREKVPHKFKV